MGIKIKIKQLMNDKSSPFTSYIFEPINTKIMQKLILFIIIIIFSNNVNCQVTKGNWLFGGSVSFSSTTFNSEAGQKNSLFSIKLSPEIGYFIANKLAVGTKINFDKQGLKATGTSIYSTFTDANFGPFIRYYFLSTEKQFNILAEGSCQFGFIEGNTVKTSKNTFSFAIGPVIYFTSSAGLEFLIGYTTYKYVGFAGYNNNVQFGIGFQIHLEKDK